MLSESTNTLSPPPADTYRLALLGCYLLIALLLLGTLFSWLVVDPIKYIILAELQAERSLKEAAVVGLYHYSPRIASLLIILLLITVKLVLLEWRQGALSLALRVLPNHHFYLIGLTILMWLTHSYFFPGHLLGGDAGSHIVQLAQFGSGLREGKVLFWNNNFYMGSPFLQFYPPLFTWLGGSLYALTGSVDWAVKLLLWGLHAASGILFFLFLRTVGSEHLAALIGALVYTGAWAHGQLIWYQGVLPQALTMALLPAAFLLAERLLHAEQRYGWDWAGLALISAALLVAHQPHGLFGGIYLGAYVLARLIMQRGDWRALLAIACAGSVGVVMALFVIVPYLLEQPYVMAGAGSGLFQFHLPDLEYFRHLLVWRNTATTHGNESVAYVGISSCLLASLAVVTARRWRRGATSRAAWIGLLLIMLLISLVWRGELVRNIIFTLFFLSALASAGAQQLLQRLPTYRSLPAMLLLVVFIDLGPIALQPLPRTDKAYLDVASNYLATISANQRTMLTGTWAGDNSQQDIRAYIGPSGGPLQYAGVQTVGGPHNHAATLAHNFIVTIIIRANSELRQNGVLSPDTQNLLAMLNVSRVVNDYGRGMGLPGQLAGTVVEPPLGRILPVPHSTPVLFAPELVAIMPPATLEKPIVWDEHYRDPMTPQATGLLDFIEQIRRTMLPLTEQRQATRLAVRELPAGYQPPPRDPATARVRLDHYQVTSDRVWLTVATDRPGFLQLAHPWYPLLEVRDNGAVVSPLRSTLGLLVVPVTAGTHAIELQPRRSTVRVAFGVLGVVSLVGALSVPFVSRHRLGRPPR